MLNLPDSLVNHLKQLRLHLVCKIEAIDLLLNRHPTENNRRSQLIANGVDRRSHRTKNKKTTKSKSLKLKEGRARARAWAREQYGS
jgi:hypothetical protein